MNNKWKLSSLSLGLAASLATVAAPAAQAPRCEKPQYSVTDLGVLGKGTNSLQRTDMNSIGWVAGSSNLVPNGPQHAFLWYGSGPLRDLGTLGGPNSGADGPNLYGEAAVGSELATTDPDKEDFCAFGTHLVCRGAIWRYGKLTAVAESTRRPQCQRFWRKQSGPVGGLVGEWRSRFYLRQGNPFQVFRYEAVKWEPNGKIHELRPLQGDTVAFAMGLNDLGQAVGSSGTCATQGVPPQM